MQKEIEDKDIDDILNLEDVNDIKQFSNKLKKDKKKLIDSTGIPKNLLKDKEELEEPYLDNMDKLELLED